METTLDRFGSIVIPKKIREVFNLRAGSPVQIEERNDGILIKPIETEPNLIEKDGVLVFSCKSIGDVEKALDDLRQDRHRSLGRME